jgi:hypothetical protein
LAVLPHLRSSHFCDYQGHLGFKDALPTVLYEASVVMKHHEYRFWERIGCGQFGDNIPIFPRGKVRKHGMRQQEYPVT